jgi:hypothetical protein
MECDSSLKVHQIYYFGFTFKVMAKPDLRGNAKEACDIGEEARRNTSIRSNNL